MARHAQVDYRSLTAEQRAFVQAVTDSPRPRTLDEEGKLAGPFGPWLATPDFGIPAARLGELLRFRGRLDGRLRELATMTVAAHWRTSYEWWAHSRAAVSEGLPEEACQSVADGRGWGAEHSQERIVTRAALALLRTGTLGDADYTEALSLLGEEGVVELTFLVGYYSLVSFTLNIFGVEAPGGTTPPWQQDDGSMPAGPGQAR
jgi:4-carboxymuconolactone decarboxylase